jgi:hypothetical protein
MSDKTKSVQPSPAGLTNAEYDFLRSAALYLEEPSLLLRVTEFVGQPVETLLKTLPTRVHGLIASGTNRALRRALDWAIYSLPEQQAAEHEPIRALVARDSQRHATITAMTGAVGGFFGLAGAAVEIPLTTTVMLRSIARIAADSGARLEDPATRLECLAVFSLGSRPLEAMDSAYLTTRVGMSLAIESAAHWIAATGLRGAGEALARGTAPILTRLVGQIAARFETVVGQKIALQSVPLLGAATGAALNAAFTSHFNQLARYHFGILRLERQYGSAQVQAVYRDLCGRLQSEQR